MPRKIPEEKIVRTHVLLFERDIERVKSLYGDDLGFSKAIRLMVRKVLDHIEARAAASSKSVHNTELPDLD